MKTRSMVLILAVCALAMALSAADNPWMGTWKLNEARSKIPAEKQAFRSEASDQH